MYLTKRDLFPFPKNALRHWKYGFDEMIERTSTRSWWYLRKKKMEIMANISYAH